MAIKTEQEIERDFFSLIRESELGKAIKGGIYRSDLRPNGSAAEDVIVKFLAGTNGQIQRGVVILNVYVPDVPYLNDGRLVADHARIGELQRIVNDFITGQTSTEYRLKPDETPRTEAVEDIGQHFIYTRIHFERIAD